MALGLTLAPVDLADLHGREAAGHRLLGLGPTLAGLLGGDHTEDGILGVVGPLLALGCRLGALGRLGLGGHGRLLGALHALDELHGHPQALQLVGAEHLQGVHLQDGEHPLAPDLGLDDVRELAGEHEVATGQQVADGLVVRMVAELTLLPSRHLLSQPGLDVGEGLVDDVDEGALEHGDDLRGEVGTVQLEHLVRLTANGLGALVGRRDLLGLAVLDDDELGHGFNPWVVGLLAI